LPDFATISGSNEHDLKYAWELRLEPHSVITADRAYNCFRLFWKWECEGVFFVLRAKSNMDYSVIEEREVPAPVGRPPKSGESARPVKIISDQVIQLNGAKASEDYPKNLRLVTAQIDGFDKPMVFMANNFKWSPVTIAEIAGSGGPSRPSSKHSKARCGLTASSARARTLLKSKSTAP
jgi:hypothetical protein